MEKELQFDARKLDTGAQEELRKKIVRKMKKHMNDSNKIYDVYEIVADLCEVSQNHVKNTWLKYKKGGVEAIKAVKMGRPKGNTKLTKEQEKEVIKMITEKDPNQLKFKGFLWDRKLVAALIKRNYNIDMPLSTMGNYLNKWGFSAQRPLKRNYKQNPEQVQKWLNEEYPVIKKRAKAENAEINWSDETGIQNETNYIKGYAPIGKTPILPINSQKIHINMVSAITNKGKLRFMFYRDSMTQEKFIKFMKRLIRTNNKKIFLIVDNLKVHHGKIVRGWLEENADKIEVFYLPPYAPEYNPDEYLNGNLKRDLAKKGFAKDVNELESKARGTMKMFQINKKHTSNFFKNVKVRYAS